MSSCASARHRAARDTLIELWASIISFNLLIPGVSSFISIKGILPLLLIADKNSTDRKIDHAIFRVNYSNEQLHNSHVEPFSVNIANFLLGADNFVAQAAIIFDACYVLCKDLGNQVMVAQFTAFIYDPLFD